MAKGLHTCYIKIPKQIGTNGDTRLFSNFDTLQHPNRVFPERGSSLNNDQFVVLYNKLSVGTFNNHSVLPKDRSFTYVTAHSPTLKLMNSAHSPTFLSLHLHHSSFSNPSVALPTSQLILQPFRCLTYVTANSQTLLSLLLRHRLFTYVTWRAAHGYLKQNEKLLKKIHSS